MGAMRSLRLGIIVVICLFALAFLFAYVRVESPSHITRLTTNIDPVQKIIKSEIAVAPERFFIRAQAAIVDLYDTILVGFSNWGPYQHLASPQALRYVRITAGMRKEEVAETIGRGLGWSSEQKKIFLGLRLNAEPLEGYFFPGVYAFPASASPKTVKALLLERFNAEVRARYATSTANVISMNTAITIASILEREAAGRSDMRLISGIIWQRIFAGMSLDIDATLQYAKGNATNGWWPPVEPSDKFIASPYNTYRNKGLPPTPISSPSLEAIYAALNPQKTNCLYYFHDTRRVIHCSPTYKQHLALIDRYY